MALERKRGGKSETLSLRLDPKTRFALEFVARIKGQSITTIVERAIKREADDVRVGEVDLTRTWLDYWSISEGVRSIKLAADSDTFPTFDEEEMFSFISVYWPFFGEDPSLVKLDSQCIDVLWPNIDKYLNSWRVNKSKNRKAVAELMHDDLVKAHITPPEYPFVVEKTGKPPDRTSRRSDLRPGIPF